MTAEDLRAWAEGDYPSEAAVELLIRALHGRFAQPGNPWIITDDGRCWVDWDAINDDTTAGLSSGEKSLLRIAASIGGGRPVDLNDTIPGLDRKLLALVLGALAHAAGSHQDSGVVRDTDGTPTHFEDLDSLYPWPTPTATVR